MPLHSRLPFYIFLLYPIFGYISINFWGQRPFIFLSGFLLIAFLDRLGKAKKRAFPLHLTYFFLFILSVTISKYFVNGFTFKIDTHFAQIVYSLLALFFLFIIENSTFSINFIKSTKTIIKYVIFASAIVAIVQYFIPNFFYNSEIYQDYSDNSVGYSRRIASIFTWGDFNASQYIAIGLVIMYGILVVEYRNKKTIFFALQLLVAIVVLTSQFRIAMVTFVLTTLILGYSKISIKNIVIIVFSSLAFIFVINVLEFNLDYFIENRLKSDSAYTRLAAFTAFFHAFPENPYFGTGGVLTDALFEGYGHAARLHNAHLAVAYYYGIFAFIFHTLFIITITSKTFKTGRVAGYWPPFVGMLCYITATMTMPSGFFLEPGLIIMMVFNKYHYDLYLMNKTIYKNVRIE